MKKVVVGMSGGVDSAVCALLLKNAGYDVMGITLRTWQADDGTESRCCDIDDARNIANRIGIRYLPVNCTFDFKEKIVDPFINNYLCGLTPNPCVECNRYVKWDKLLYYAKVVGAECVATGHYASVVKLDNGRYTVKKALHTEKDQTYMLYKLTQEQLAATLMPLGNLSKSEVRKIAEDAGLPVASKPDSQEVCFVTSGNYADFIDQATRTDPLEKGLFVDGSGNVLGEHKGIAHYTVGQRKGLGIALGYPVYVREIRADRNEVVLGDEKSLYSSEILCRDVNFMSINGLKKEEKIPCIVKIRYLHPGQSATIEQYDNDHIRISFDKPVRAPAPGQSAVFYDENDCVIGGGVIEMGIRKSYHKQ